MSLESAEQLQEVRELIADVFSPADLELLVSGHLGVPLPHLVASGTHPHRVYELVEACRQRGWLERLLVGVATERPQNTRVTRLVQQLLPTALTSMAQTGADDQVYRLHGTDGAANARRSLAHDVRGKLDMACAPVSDLSRAERSVEGGLALAPSSHSKAARIDGGTDASGAGSSSANIDHASAQVPNTRFLVVFQVTMRQFDTQGVAQIVDKIQEITGDVTVRVIRIEEGSVRVTLEMTAEAARKLMQLRQDGELGELCGMPIVVAMEIVSLSNEVRITEKAVAQRKSMISSASSHVTAFAGVATDGIGGVLATAPRFWGSHDIAGLGTEEESPNWRDLPTPDGSEQSIQQLLDTGRRNVALRALMSEYGASTYSFLLRVVRDSSLAEDILQQVFLELYRNLASVHQNSKTSYRALIYTLASARAQDALRTKRRFAYKTDRNVADIADADQTLDTADASQSSDAEIDRQKLSLALDSCLKIFSESVRICILLRFNQQMSYDQIGVALKVSPGTAQARVARALPVLRRCLERKGFHL